MWNMLKSGKSAISQIPDTRWPVAELQHPQRAEAGRSVTFSAGVLSDIEQFDPSFFGISPREAAWLDPQQRLLLTMSYEAMENAHVRPSALAGSHCGVYVGISSLDYGQHALEDMASISAHVMTGNTLSVAANRISYIFDLHGPSMAMDTACSSSLVALHHACQALRSGELPCALVGGVSLLLHPYSFIGFSKASMLSAHGQCRPFDAAADGYVRAEGGGVLLLKPLDAALRDGDPVQAVVLSSGVNADGARKSGLTIPSADAQAELMQEVLSRSGLSPEDIDFIEAHGTGTPVGDPVEVDSIGRVFGRGRMRPVPISSAKAAVGHLEPASGMAGLVKAILSLKHGEIPPMPLAFTPNPHIDFAGQNVICAAAGLSLPAQKALHAGVNSFGFGGVNAHILLESAPAVPRSLSTSAPCASLATEATTMLPPLFLSARSEASLRGLAAAYAARLEQADAAEWYDAAYCAAFHRDRLEHRLAMTGTEPAAVCAALRTFADGQTTALAVTENAVPASEGIVFVYTGNGAQWQGMGRTLYAESPTFARAFSAVDAALRPLLGCSLLDVLLGEDAAPLQDTTVSQPLLFAIQVGVTQVLRKWGVMPQAVMGHSVGEIAAAWAAGALSFAQAVQVIYARSQAQGKTRGAGRMAAVGMSAEAVRQWLTEHNLAEDIEIAGINSPHNVTLSGGLDALLTLKHYADGHNIFFRLLDLEYAFHSRHMDSVREFLAQELRDLTPAAHTSALFVSTVTGDAVDGGALNGEYWWNNVRQPVRFADAMHSAAARGFTVFVEIGPHAILQRYIREGMSGAGVKGRVLSTLLRGEDGQERLIKVAMRLHLLTNFCDLHSLFPHAGKAVQLPTYAWDNVRCWFPRSSECLPETRRIHPLLGWPLSGVEPAWENILDPAKDSWLADHNVGGAIVYPGAGYAELALAAASATQQGEHLILDSLDIAVPLVFEGGHAQCVRCGMTAADGSFRIVSRPRLGTGAWVRHAAGRIVAATGRTPLSRMDALPADCRHMEGGEVYALTDALGLNYGPAFRVVRQLRMRGDRLDAELTPLPAEEGHFLLHPVALDACFHALAALYVQVEHEEQTAFLPVSIGRLERITAGTVSHIRAHLHHRGRRSMAADFELLDDKGTLLALARNCRFRAAPASGKKQQHVEAWRIRRWLTPLHDAQASAMPPLEQLAAITAPSDDSEERELWFTHTLPLMEAMALSFAVRAFSALANASTAWQPLPAGAYARWLASTLHAEGLLEMQDDMWRAVPTDLPPAEELWREALSRHPQSLPALLPLGRVGSRLEDILRGHADGSALYESMRKTSVLREAQAVHPLFTGVRQAMERTLAQVTGAWPENRRLRILDISASSDSMAEFWERQLPADRMDYVLALTDAEAVSAVKARYSTQAFVRVTSFDAAAWNFTENDAPQGPFDVILLRHTLHNAAAAGEALARLHALLASGALLLTAEQYPDWSADFVEGLQPDWWRTNLAHTDMAHAERPFSALLTPEAWCQLLETQGFSATRICREPAAGDLREGAYLLMSLREQEEQPSSSEELAHASWLLLADEASREVAEALRARLAARGQEVVCSYEDISLLPHMDHVVFLRGAANAPQHAAATVDALAGCVRQLASADTAQEGGEQKNAHLWLVTRGGALCAELPQQYVSNPAQCALAGLARVASNEYGDALSCTLLDGAPDMPADVLAARLEGELLTPDGADEILLTADARYTLRLEPAANTSSAAAERWRLDFATPGRLGNLAWHAELPQPVAADAVEARVMATGLNFRDIMLTMGLVPDDAVEDGFAGATLGLEFSGIVTRVGADVTDLAVGDKIVGFAPACFASHVVTPARSVTRMPEGWSHAMAAAIPTVFFTAWYALKHLAQLQSGERLLIHGAAGGVGFAAIQIARHLGAEVFATAGSEEKRDFLRLLDVDHIFDSRSLTFEDDIRAATDGEGVDVVLNSLAGEAMRRSVGLLKPFGRFLELGKRDYVENTTLGLRPFKENISYFAIDADQLLTARPALAEVLFREVMTLLAGGTLAPLPYRVFSGHDVVAAFRAMQQAQHIGKIVVTPADAPRLPAAAAQPIALQLANNTSWLITGGLSGFGLAVARHLVERGARHLILVGRRGAQTPGADAVLEEFSAQGVYAQAEACDMTDENAVQALMARVSESMPPLAGVVHAAAVFDDCLLPQLTPERLERVLAPKLSGAWHLHEATRHLPLQYFVLFSSISVALGNPSQANYVAANAGLEGLTQLRRHMGLPAVCMEWGPVGDTGYLTRHDAVKKSLAQRLGKAPMTAAEALREFDAALLAGGQHIFANVEWKTALGMFPCAATRFAAVASQDEHSHSAASGQDLRELLTGKTSAEALAVIRGLVMAEVAQVLALDAGQVPQNRSLQSLGLDSLMAVELAVGLEQRAGVKLPPMMFSDAPTVEQVAERIMARLHSDTPENEEQAMMTELARRHAEDMDADSLTDIVNEAAAGKK